MVRRSELASNKNVDDSDKIDKIDKIDSCYKVVINGYLQLPER